MPGFCNTMAPHPGKGGVDSLPTASRERRRGGWRAGTNWNYPKATSQYPKDIRCPLPPSPTYHELVLQGFQNLAGSGGDTKKQGGP